MSSQDLGPQLLNGCCHEAERAARVAGSLLGLRNALPEKLHPHLTGVINHINITSVLLRDLADKSQVHISRAQVVMDYINTILPCLCKTLRDITAFYEDKTMTKEHRWRKMYHVMSNELPGTTLPARFILYNTFLGSLRDLLAR